jgi:hypothetical protein
MLNGIRFDLGDSRLDSRCSFLLKGLSKRPGCSFPKIFIRHCELESLYRFVNNCRVTWANIFIGIKEKTLEVIAEENHTEVLVLHDTTQVEADSKKDRIEEFYNSKNERHEGFFAHVSLAVKNDGSRRILGPLGLFLWGRGKKKLANERDRWGIQIAEVNKNLPSLKCIHVADREGDMYRLFCELQSAEVGYVIRLTQDRKTKGQGSDSIFQDLKKLAPLGVIESEVSKRKGSNFPRSYKSHPTRAAREVTLQYFSGKFVVKKSASKTPKGYPSSLELNIVRVAELDPPAGEKPIEWILATSEAIETSEDAKKVIEIYRTRWVIEEYFKVLKTTCRVDERSFKDAEAWYNSLAMFSQVACEIYNLKIDDEKYEESKKLLTQTQWEILTSLAKKENRKVENIRDAKREIAYLGGFIKYGKGPPGWMVLARGYLDLLVMEIGWLAAVHRNM